MATRVNTPGRSDVKNVQLEQEVYQKEIARFKPSPPYGRSLGLAFVTGGAFCLLGQVGNAYFESQGLDPASASARSAILLVLLAAILTGLGVYDEIGRFGGAGAAIPITGFANTVVAPAMEFRREGMVLGMAAQMFIVAGPVIVYGIVSAVAAALLRVLLVGAGSGG